MDSVFFYDTEIGRVGLAGDGDALVGFSFSCQQKFGDCKVEETPVLQEAAKQLREYFAGERREFTVPLAPRGTEFQKTAWNALLTIPYGETRTYKQMAEQIGNPKACRAVGLANNRNPLAIFIPCHRVVGSNGKLVGFAGGLDVKAKLLRLEKEHR